MTFDFNKLVTIGSDKWKTAPFKFYGEKEPFFIGNKIEQKWQDIILKGVTALSLVNAKADSLEYLKLFGKCEKDFTPVSMDYETVYNMQHSTFDLSKFTVVGSPTITDDGIASGFSEANYLQHILDKKYTLDQLNVKGKFKTPSIGTLAQDIIFALVDANTGGLPGTVLQLSCFFTGNNTGKIALAGHNDATWQGWYSTRNDIAFDTEYYFHAYYQNGNIHLDVSLDNVNYIEYVNTPITIDSTFKANLLRLGSIGANVNNFTGSIDLSQFSITVDGVEVFSGNKTGIDTYTINGLTVSIPYTLSNMGDKIVDSVYLPRVQSAIENLQTSTYIIINNSDQTATDYRGRIICNNGAIKVSKNLFDYRYFYDNYMRPSTSTIGRVAIKLLPNTDYTVSTNTQQGSTSAQVWTGSGNDVGGFSPNTGNNGVLIDTPRTIQSDSNGYIILAIRVDTDYALEESDFESGTVWVQIEQGSTVTPYVPYGEIYTDGTQEVVTDSLGNTANAERLLAVGSYKDTQEVLTGSVTRNVGIKVLDGTEIGWTKLSNVNYVSLPKTAISNMVSGTDATCLSNNFVQVPHSIMSLSVECFSVGASYMNFKKAGDPTVAQFTQFLADQYAQGTPCIVIYPVSSPITESVSPQPLTIQQGTNVIEITEASIDNLALEVKYKAGVSVTIQEVTSANLDNSVQVTIG